MRPFWKPWKCDLQWFGIHLGRKPKKISIFFSLVNLRNEHERTHHRWWYSCSNFQLLKKKRSAGVDSLPLSLPVLAEYQIIFHGRNKNHLSIGQVGWQPIWKATPTQTHHKNNLFGKKLWKSITWQTWVQIGILSRNFKTYNETYGFGKGHPYEVLLSMLHFRASVTCDCGSKSLKSHLMVGILWKNGPINVASQTVPRTNLQTWRF